MKKTYGPESGKSKSCGLGGAGNLRKLTYVRYCVRCAFKHSHPLTQATPTCRTVRGAHRQSRSPACHPASPPRTPAPPPTATTTASPWTARTCWLPSNSWWSSGQRRTMLRHWALRRRRRRPLGLWSPWDAGTAAVALAEVFLCGAAATLSLKWHLYRF